MVVSASCSIAMFCILPIMNRLAGRKTPLPNSAHSLFCVIMALLFFTCTSNVQSRVWIENGRLSTSAGAYFIKGVCYHPVNIGETTRTFDSLTSDLALMKEMGVNTIRVYEPIVSESILDEIHAAGIKVIVGFGYNQGGVFDLQSGTYLDYVRAYKNHPAVLVWELGNEYNYHPEWFEGDIEVWYRILRTGCEAIHALDPNHPVATAHGEVPSAALIQELAEIDLWGLNVYRWDESHTALRDFSERSEKPVYFSELGADSYMTESNLGYAQGENQRAQADATRNMLENILTDSTRAAGVTLFSFTDGWWKAGNAGQQDMGGWAPGSSGVPYDATANEEYWGLVNMHREKKEAFWIVKSHFESFELTPGH